MKTLTCRRCGSWFFTTDKSTDKDAEAHAFSDNGCESTPDDLEVNYV